MSPESVPLIEAITERDIDLLLLEDIHASSDFAAWLVKQVFGPDVSLGKMISAYHSIFDADGESDIVVRFRDRSGMDHGILLENKVNAPPQPEQATRYRKRADTGTREGQWAKSKTVLVAPAEYLASRSDGYDERISYEEIAAWYEAQTPNNARAVYRARIMRDAIIRARRTGISRLDPIVTAFWKMYHADATLLFPELGMKVPGDKGPSSTWIQPNTRSQTWARVSRLVVFRRKLGPPGRTP